MFLLWILLILLISYVISVSVIAIIPIDELPESASFYEKLHFKSTLANRIFFVSAILMFSIWGAAIYFSEPPKPFTEKMAQQIIATDDDPGFAFCVNSFDTDSESFYSASEVKQVCTCIKEKKLNEKKTYIGTTPWGSETVYWAECTKYFCQTDSCELVEKYWDKEKREQVRALEKLLYQ